MIRCLTCNNKVHHDGCGAERGWICGACKPPKVEPNNLCGACEQTVLETIGYQCENCLTWYHTFCMLGEFRCEKCNIRKPTDDDDDHSSDHSSDDETDPRDKQIADLQEMIRTAAVAAKNVEAAKDAEIVRLNQRIGVAQQQLRDAIAKAKADTDSMSVMLADKDNQIAELKRSSGGSGDNPDASVWDEYKAFMSSTPNQNSSGGSSGGGGTSGSTSGANFLTGALGALSIYDGKADEKARSKYKCTNAHVLGSPEAILILNARKSLRELPDFDGSPTNWPMFMHAFIETTQAGNYSESENISRLQKALKGKARNLVNDDLGTSEVASKIMLDLENVFGNTDNVVVQLAHDLRKIKKCDSVADPNLIKFRTEVGRFNNTLKVMGRESETVNAMLLAEVEDRLGPFHLPTWTLNKNGIRLQFNREPSFVDLEAYLRHITKGFQVKTMDDLNAFKLPDGKKQQHSKPKNVNAHQAGESSNSQSSSGCYYCNARHYLRDCNKFKQLSVDDRHSWLMANSTCTRCLGKDKHQFRSCTRHKCATCGENHHELVHGWKKSTPSPTNPFVNSLTHFANNNHSDGETADVLHKIAPVKIFKSDGSHIVVYVMFDDCSDLTMIDADLADELKCSVKHTEKITIIWTTGITRTEDCNVVSIDIQAVKGGRKYRLGEVHTCKEVNLLKQTFKYKEMVSKFPYLAGFDLPDLENVQPMMLIGLRHASLMQIRDHRMPKEGDFGPILSQSAFGWLVWGPTAHPDDPPQRRSMNCHRVLHVYYQREDDTEKLVREYFTRDNMGIVQSPKLVSAETQRSLDIMNSTICFTNGRYEIGLLWKSDDVTLPDNFNEAVRRLYADEKRLEKLGLVEWKDELIRKHIENGEVRKATEKDLSTSWPRVSYGPHFVTFNLNKEPPKPRNVVDVASKFNGVSLNSCLLKGPDNLAPLICSLMRLRENHIAFTADIKAMFHQIRIREVDQQCQRFLYRGGDKTKDPKDCIYISECMIFGPKDSPAKAQFVKNYHAEKYRESHPKAHRVITEFTYVDDSSDSQPTIDDAYECATDCIKIYKEGGFELVGFQSNSLELLKKLPKENVKLDLADCDFNAGPENELVTKILGMHWSTTTDEFFFKRRVDENLQKMIDGDVTKRRLLRMVMQLFDPLGFLQLMTVRGRQLIQEVWKAGFDWDEAVDDDIRKSWLELHDELELVTKVRIPRQFAPIVPAEWTKQLVVFVDASDKVYAAVVYLVFRRGDEVHVSLVTSKARLRGTKYKSIPKLELDGAVLGLRLGKLTIDWLSFDVDDIIFLSDSRTVLCWISSSDFKFNAYVEPRIAEILDSSTVKQWYHVPSKENVADDATKWSGVREIDSHSRWFTGPSWMREKFEIWPITPAAQFKGKKAESNEYHFCAHRLQPPLHEFDAVDRVELSQSLSWNEFLHAVAVNSKSNDDGQPATVTANDLAAAQKLAFRKIQSDLYWPLIRQLNALYKRKGSMSKVIFTDTYNDIVDKDLIQYRPFIGTDGLMRQFSRAQHADIPYDMKFPVILNSSHPLAEFMVSCFHRANYHCLDQNVIADLNERCRMLHARRCLKSVKAKCQECIRFKAMPKHPFMGDLHPSRVDYTSPPFTNTGLDLFGYYMTRIGRGQPKKRYAIIFTCLTYRAVHIEMVDSLSAEDCMLAIRNFLAATGSVTKLFMSDNGTNFTASKKLIVKDFYEMQSVLGEAVAKLKNIEWKFNAKYSPWMGGAWERMIGSVKSCLDFALKGEVVDPRVLQTALKEIAALLNRRPLTHVPVDPADGMPFTPNSILIGNKDNDLDLIAFQPDVGDLTSPMLYRRAEHISRKCMDRFVREYLPEIAKREKWYVEREVRVGDEVLQFKKETDRKLWKKAVVVKVHPGKDGVVRVVDIETLEEKPKRKNYRSVATLIFTGRNIGDPAAS